MFVPWSKLDRELGSWQCTKHLQSSVDQYAQLIPSLNTFINTPATLYQHLGWHLIDTPSTLCSQQSIESPLIFDRLHMSQSTLWWPQAVRWETLGTRLPTMITNCWSHIIQVPIECWKSINPDVDWVHANQNVDCRSIEGIDQHWTQMMHQVKSRSQINFYCAIHLHCSFCEKTTSASLQV